MPRRNCWQKRNGYAAYPLADGGAFGIWERRGGNGRNVTFPARQYSINGERRSFALLRPVVDTTAQNRIRERILDAYAQYEQELEVAR